MEMYSVIGSQYDLCTIVLGLTYRYKYLATIATLTYCMQEEDNRDEQHKMIETGWLAGWTSSSFKPSKNGELLHTDSANNEPLPGTHTRTSYKHTCEWLSILGTVGASCIYYPASS